MTGFSIDWLRLREPFDHAARKEASLAIAGQFARWRQRSTGKELRVVDLACGHGSNVRALAPRLGGAQHWRLIDHDPALLAAVPLALAEWARQHGFGFTVAAAAIDPPIEICGPDFHATVVRQQVDLARDLATLEFGEAPLVTASALLDLVSASWLETLIGKAQSARSALLFALNVDGRSTWEPVDPGDGRVKELFDQHQRRDKGFGMALGPQAVGIALQQMAIAGYETLRMQTDWVIDGAHAAAMQLAMIEGMAAAALEQDPTARDEVQSWQDRRGFGIAASRLRVGHVDIVATPA